MNKKWVRVAGLLGFLGVVAGAAGAHAVHEANLAGLVEKAAYFQMIHAVLLLFLAEKEGKIASLARLAVLCGITLFCGSLYLKGFGVSASAPLAPFGGILLMLSWLLVACGNKK